MSFSMYNNLPNGGMTFEQAKQVRVNICQMMLAQYKHYRVRLASPDAAWEHAQQDVEKSLAMISDCAFSDAARLLGDVNEDGLLP